VGWLGCVRVCVCVCVFDDIAIWRAVRYEECVRGKRGAWLVVVARLLWWWWWWRPYLGRRVGGAVVRWAVEV
jgi:hypothetical protein